MFGLDDDNDIKTLVQLAAITANENDINPDGGEYNRALRSFPNPEQVHNLAVSTWQHIALYPDADAP